VFVRQGQLYALIIALVALSGTWLFLQRTMLGRAIRGTADNRDGAQYVGIDVPGSTRSPSGSVPRWRTRGCSYPAVPVVHAGARRPVPDKRVRRGRAGRARILPGAFVGGLIIGFIQVFGSAYLGGSTYQIVIFMAFILVLLVKPEGLLGGSDDE